MYVGMGGLGWSPFFNINGYLLDSKVGNAKRNLSAISPSVDWAYAGRTGGVSFGVGYTWVHNPVVTVACAEGGSSNRVTGSFGGYSNGARRRAMRPQLLSTYNSVSRYLWARGRAS